MRAEPVSTTLRVAHDPAYPLRAALAARLSEHRQPTWGTIGSGNVPTRPRTRDTPPGATAPTPTFLFAHMTHRLRRGR